MRKPKAESWRALPLGTRQGNNGFHASLILTLLSIASPSFVITLSLPRHCTREPCRAGMATRTDYRAPTLTITTSGTGRAGGGTTTRLLTPTRSPQSAKFWKRNDEKNNFIVPMIEVTSAPSDEGHGMMYADDSPTTPRRSNSLRQAQKHISQAQIVLGDNIQSLEGDRNRRGMYTNPAPLTA